MNPIRRAAVLVTAVTALLGTVIGGVSAASQDGGATGTPATTGSNTIGAMATIGLGTHNVYRGAARFASFAGVIGWQEVNAGAPRRKLRNQLGGEYRTFWPSAGPAKSVPISWRAERFRLLRSGSIRTHGGEAGVTPARYVNWVILKIRGTTKKFVFVNTHFISGAWSKHPERQARWNTHYRKLRDKAAQLRRNHPGKPLFVVGDFNRRKAMAMPSPVQYVRVIGASGVPIDHMYAPSTTNHTRVSRLPKRGSDHHSYRMHATF